MAPTTDSEGVGRPGSADDALRPYLDLARAIQADVARLVADDAAGIDALADAISRFPEQERARVAREVFGRLSPERQWTVLEEAFGDEEIRAHLHAEREARLVSLRRERAWGELARGAHEAGCLDTASLPPGTPLSLGLFREGDVRAALERGIRSDTCARRLGLLVHEPGRLRVIDDVFNPRGGYFVTSEYDEHTWLGDRLPAHALVRVGSLTGPGEPMLDPEVYPGARVDVEVDGRATPGRLHLGFASLGTCDVFAG